MAPAVIAALISAATALSGTAYGGIKSGKARREQEGLLKKQESENKAWYNSNALGDYTQRKDVQDLLRQLRQQLTEQNRTQANTSVVTGATPEQQAAQKELSNKAIANVYSNLGAQGQMYKDRVTDRYLAMKQGYADNRMGMLGAGAGSYENLMNNGLNSLSTSMGTLLNSYSAK
jgi:hypothetical protein